MTQQEAQEKFGDRLWRLSHLYKIKTKRKKLEILRPNLAQMTYLARETLRDIILKARQLGFSTLKLIEQLDYAITTPNSNSVVIAHQRDKVQVLFEIIHLAYENLPGMLKPRAGYDNRNELSFPDINSKIYVALDTRGETVHNLHISELGYLENAQEKMLGILESVPKDGIISFESTANGMSGYFYETWEDPKSEFRKHFYNWTLDRDYAEPTTKTLDQLIGEYQPLQVQYNLIPEIWDKFNLTKEQLQWYINKAIRHRDSVVQEYPTTEIEAFLASRRNVFGIASLQQHDVKDPIDRKYDDLLVWENPLPGFKYVIGVDPAEGIGEDNSAIEVLNAHTGEQVAEYVTAFVAPDLLAGYVHEIAKYYNNGFVVPEINNHGITLVDSLKKRYTNIYQREVFDTLTKATRHVFGWKTTSVTKPMMVDVLEEAIRNRDIHIHSRAALSELKTFVRTDDEGKRGFGAEGTAKDDRVIALGLAVQGIRHLPKMRAPKTDAQRKLEEYIAKKAFETNFPNATYAPRNRPRYRIR